MKIISNILLILNPICGVCIIACFMSGYWYLFPLFIIIVILVLKFHFYTHKDDFIKYELWKEEFSKENEYLGISNDYYQFEVWKNRKTGETFEL